MAKAKEDGPYEKHMCPNACSCYLGNALQTHQHWPRGPMDKASAYGAGDCRFESCWGHFVSHLIMVMVAITIDTRLAFATASVASHAELEKKVTTHTDNGSWTCDVRETDASRKDPAHSL